MKHKTVKILYLTNMYPEKPGSYSGIFIKREIDELKKLGLSIDYLLVDGMKNKFSYLNLIPLWKKLKENYDVVNIQHSLLLPHILFLKKILRLDVPVVLTLHEGELAKKEREKNIFLWLAHSKFWRRPLYRRIDLIIAKNIDVYRNLQVSTKYIEIPTGVDTEQFKPMDKKIARKHLGLSDTDVILFFPADRNRPEKNFSFAESLILELKKMLKKEVILLSGPQPADKMMWLYNAADIILFPSLYECSPVVIKEAMACNKPIVASNVGDIKKVIGTTAGCFVIDALDAQEYLIKIVEALNLQETQGRTTIFEKGYDWSTIGKKIYDTLVNINVSSSK
jgi:teichuronic acid biosynthesis glycosyltransferase TuaC